MLAIGRLLGDRKAETTARYAHLVNDPIKSAANRIASRIAEVSGYLPRLKICKSGLPNGNVIVTCYR